MVDQIALMRRAVAIARAGMKIGQSPFGCAIQCRSGEVVEAHNTVQADTDITAHAEVNALRSACARERSILLEGAIVATTCEPCPMCMAALHWARVQRVYFGAGIADAADAGFNELQLPAADLLQIGGSPVQLQDGVLTDECRQLFSDWLQSPTRQPY